MKSAFDLARPDPAGTIQSLASLGYSPEAAVADLVDNSIAAKASHVEINFHWEGAEGSWVSIADNGEGMNEEALVRGMTVGGRGRDGREMTDLGRFGMGLKTASFSQSRILVVASRLKGGEWQVRSWDTDHVVEVGDWELLRGCPRSAEQILSKAQTDVTSSGTIALWRGLTRMVPARSAPGDEDAQRSFYGHVDHIEAHLGMVFSRYLSGRKRLTIISDGRPIRGWDPFLRTHKFLEQLALEVPLPGVTVQGFVLPHRSRLTEHEYLDAGGPRGWLDQQGFYIYRRDRLIVAGDWLKIGDFRKDEKHVLARIAVDLPAESDEEWALDVKKSTAMPPAALVGHLRRVAKATRERAGAVMNHRGRVVRDRQTQSEDFTWRTVRRFGRTRFVVNRDHPLVRDLGDRSPEIRKDLNRVLGMIDATLPVGLIRSTVDTAEQVDVDSDGEIPDDVIDMARRVLEVLLSRGESVSSALARVARMPPFNEYPSVADTLSGRSNEQIDEANR